MVVAVWYICNPILNTSIQLLARGDALLIPTSEAQLPVHKMPPMHGDAAQQGGRRRRLRIKGVPAQAPSAIDLADAARVHEHDPVTPWCSPPAVALP